MKIRLRQSAWEHCVIHRRVKIEMRSGGQSNLHREFCIFGEKCGGQSFKQSCKNYKKKILDLCVCVCVKHALVGVANFPCCRGRVCTCEPPLHLKAMRVH